MSFSSKCVCVSIYGVSAGTWDPASRRNAPPIRIAIVNSLKTIFIYLSASASLPFRTPDCYYDLKQSMVEISIDGEQLHLEVRGLDKLGSFKGKLNIPL